MNIDFDGRRILLNGKDVSSNIREHYISDSVSDYSSNIIIRNKLSSLQRKLARNKDVVVEGRDIATNVFPSADYKFYLDANIEVRARRRFDELNINKYSYEKILNKMLERDRADKNRQHSPLLKVDDAVYIDNTVLSLNEQVNIIIDIINN